MADNEKNLDNVEIEPLSDSELDGVAGGDYSQPSVGVGFGTGEGSSNSCCTCSGDNCSLTEPDEPGMVG